MRQLQAVMLGAALALTISVATAPYNRYGRELPLDPMLWSHQMLGHWLGAAKPWHRHVPINPN
eukprot:SAG31_NODE_19970_length_587_cov_0.956967_1_plen_63_part_00